MPVSYRSSLIELPGEIEPGSVEAADFFTKEYAHFMQRLHDREKFRFEFQVFTYTQLPGKTDAHVKSYLALAFLFRED